MFIPNEKALFKAFEFSIYGTRGGPVRLRILAMLAKRGMNTNQISTRLGIDYKTAQHHMRVLEKSGFVTRKSSGNENVYSLSELVRSSGRIMRVVAGKK